MKHPEVILVPVLMLADYFLTVVGSIQRAKKYDEHFKVEHYEMNPKFQKDIADRKWFSPRHVISTVVTTVVLVLLSEFEGMPQEIIEGFLGFLLVLYGSIVGMHICNLLTFRRISLHPEEISGQVCIAHSLALSMSRNECMILAVPMVLLAILRPTPFVVGGLVGTGRLFLLHWKWIRRYRRGLKSTGQVEAEKSPVRNEK